ncbi:hypothetical protein BaRGS_00001902 [Batillaria attramentaria]|uniref:Uncharacterized protein n=1 Tax=Batillaria attramentaria TaxID=370345 RepID=A0ABD0M6J7_9CAEN
MAWVALQKYGRTCPPSPYEAYNGLPIVSDQLLHSASRKQNSHAANCQFVACASHLLCTGDKVWQTTMGQRDATRVSIEFSRVVPFLPR